MGKAARKLSGTALADFKLKHPRGARGRFVKKGAAAPAPAPKPQRADRGRARDALNMSEVRARAAAIAGTSDIWGKLARADQAERRAVPAPVPRPKVAVTAASAPVKRPRAKKADAEMRMAAVRANANAIAGGRDVWGELARAHQAEERAALPKAEPVKRPRVRNALKAPDLRTGDLAGFNREQLRRAARDRLIPLRRGASEGTIARELVADVRRERPAARALGRAAAPVVPSAPRGKNKFHRDLSGDMAELVDTIEKSAVKKEKSLAGGAVGDTRLVEYANGRKVVRKEAVQQFGQNTPQMQADAEQLSSLVLRALGLRAPRVYRSDKDGAKVIHMEYVDKAKAPSPWRDTLQDTDEGRVMALADTLIINGDRHHGNWFIKDGHIVPIDNGLAFDEKYFHALRPGWDVPRGHFSKSDIAEIRTRLEKLKPDFELVGRGDWHRDMMRRLDRQEHRAAANGPSRLLPVLQ